MFCSLLKWFKASVAGKAGSGEGVKGVHFYCLTVTISMHVTQSAGLGFDLLLPSKSWTREPVVLVVVAGFDFEPL